MTDSTVYRSRRAKTLEEVRQLWDEARRERDELVAQIARRSEITSAACREEAALRWVEQRRGDLKKIFHAGTPGRTERKLVRAYKRYPEEVQAELFPPIELAALPDRPTEQDDLERRWAEVEAARATWPAVVEQLEADAQRLEELKLRRRRAKVVLKSLVTGNRMAVETVDNMDAAYERSIDAGAARYEAAQEEGRRNVRVARKLVTAIVVFAVLTVLAILLVRLTA